MQKQRSKDLPRRVSYMLRRFADLYKDGVDIRDTEFCRELGINQSRFKAWKYGTVRRINDTDAKYLAEKLCLNQLWISDGKGSPTSEKTESGSDSGGGTGVWGFSLNQEASGAGNGMDGTENRKWGRKKGKDLKHWQKAQALRDAGVSEWDFLWADAQYLYKLTFNEWPSQIGHISAIGAVLNSGTIHARTLKKTIDMHFQSYMESSN